MPDKIRPMSDKTLPMPDKIRQMSDKTLPMPDKIRQMSDKTRPMPDKTRQAPDWQVHQIHVPEQEEKLCHKVLKYIPDNNKERLGYEHIKSSNLGEMR